MKNKGFTLVELLAVIIVLAVIATITYPAMTDLLAKAQIRGARTRAISWVDSVDKSMVNNEFTYDYNYLTPGIYDLPLDEKYKIDVKGTKPTGGWVEVGEDGIERYSIVIDDKYVVTNMGDEITVKKGTDTEKSIYYSYVYLHDSTVNRQIGDSIAGDINIGDKYVVSRQGMQSAVFDTEQQCNDYITLFNNFAKSVDDSEEASSSVFGSSTCTFKKDYIMPKATYYDKPDSNWEIYYRYLVDENGIIKSTDVCTNFTDSKDDIYCYSIPSSIEHQIEKFVALIEKYHGKINVKDEEKSNENVSYYYTNDKSCGLTEKKDGSSKTYGCETGTGMAALVNSSVGNGLITMSMKDKIFLILVVDKDNNAYIEFLNAQSYGY